MSLEFINCFGNKITEAHLAAMEAQGAEDARRKRAAAKPKDASYHKGWRVVGIKPGLLESARESNERLRAMAHKAGGKEIPPFDEAAWLRKQTPKPVRSKPYELQEAALQCAELARKTGWIEVQVIEVKRGAPKPEALAA